MSENQLQNARLLKITEKLTLKVRNLRGEIDQLKEGVKERDKEISQLKVESDSTNKQLENKTIEAVALKAKSDKLSAQLGKAVDAHKELEQKHSKLQKDLIIQKDVMGAEEPIMLENVTKEQLFRKNKLLELTLVKLRESSLDNELKLNKEINSLSKENERWKQSEKENGNNTSKMQRLIEANEKLRSYIDGLADSEKRIESLALENSQLQADHERMSNSIKDLQDMESLDQQLIKSQELNVNELKKETEELQKLLQEKTVQCSQLKERVKRLGHIILKQQNSNTEVKETEVQRTDGNLDTEVCKLALTRFGTELPTSSLLSVMRSITLQLSHDFMDKFDTNHSEKSLFRNGTILQKVANTMDFLLHISNVPKEIIDQLRVYTGNFAGNAKLGNFSLDIPMDKIEIEGRGMLRELRILKARNIQLALHAIVEIFHGMEFGHDKSLEAELSKSEDEMKQQVTALCKLRETKQEIDKELSFTEEEQINIFVSGLINAFCDNEIQKSDIKFDHSIIFKYVQILGEWNPVNINKPKDEKKSVINALHDDQLKIQKSLGIKIMVLESRLDKLRGIEKKLEGIKDKLETEELDKKNITEKMDDINTEKHSLEKKVLKMHKILDAVGLNEDVQQVYRTKGEVRRELESIDRDTMVDQIAQQRDLIGRLSKNGPRDASEFGDVTWLKNDLKTTISDSAQFQGMNTAMDMMISLNENFNVIPFTEASDRRLSRYYLTHMEESITAYLSNATFST